VERNRGKASAYFISVGSNDLRDLKKVEEKDRKVKLDELKARFQSLMAKVSGTPGAALFVLEPIPCNKGIQKDRDQLHNWLESEIQGRKKARCVTLTRGDRPFIPRGKNGLHFSRNLWKDDLHLNKVGARLIVKALNFAMNSLGSEVFLVDPAAVEPRGGVPPTQPKPAKRLEFGSFGIRTVNDGRLGKGTGKPKQSVRKEAPVSAKSRLGPIQKGKGLPPKETQTVQALPQRSGPPADYYQRRRNELYAIFSAGMDAIHAAEQEGLLVEEGTVVVPISVCRPAGYLQGPGGPPPPPPSCGPPPPPKYPNPYYYQDVEEGEGSSRR
jgi:hypothetical protein